MSKEQSTRSKIELSAYEQEVLQQIANRVSQLRQEKVDTNYSEFAKRSGLSRQSLYRLETGRNFMIHNLIKFCKGINITLEVFFKGIK